MESPQIATKSPFFSASWAWAGAEARQTRIRARSGAIRRMDSPSQIVCGRDYRPRIAATNETSPAFARLAHTPDGVFFLLAPSQIRDRRVRQSPRSITPADRIPAPHGATIDLNRAMGG